MLQKIIKFLLINLILSISISQSTFAFSVDSSFAPIQREVKKDDVFTLTLFVEPKGSEAVYTVSTSLTYDPDALEFVDTNYGEEWFSLSTSPYKITDTVNGLIVRTAGYPTGFSGKQRFIKYTFKAKKEKVSYIVINSGKALVFDGQDVGVNSTSVKIDVTEKPITTKTENIDLSLNVKGDEAFYKERDYPFWVYVKKQEPAQDAITKVWVFNDQAELFYEDDKLWNTGKDNILEFIIPEGTMEEGNYEILAKTRYESGKEEVTIKKKIGVLSNGETWFSKHREKILPAFFLIIFVAVLHHLFTQVQVYTKLSFLSRKLRFFRKKGQIKKIRKSL